ncbi:MAG: hypothetical protein QXU32_13550 [Nitrososphaerales archaeon]
MKFKNELGLIAIATLFLLTLVTMNVEAEENVANVTWFGFTAFEIAAQDYSSVV